MPNKLIIFFFAFAASAGAVGLIHPDLRYPCGLSALLGVGGGTLTALRGLNRHLWDLQDKVRCLGGMRHTTAIDMHAMNVILRRFPECDIPTTAWSMDWPNLRVLLDVLDRRQPNMIVELGSGISTLLIAAWIRERGEGRVVSFDHDPDWAEITRRYLNKHNLESAVVHTRPLRPLECLGRTFEWYELASDLTTLDEVDLVVVDGPPAGSGGNGDARLPAAIVLHNQLAESAAIVLDDADRPGESSIVSVWQQHNPSFRTMKIAGAAVLESGPKGGGQSAAAKSPDVLAAR